MPAMLGRPPEHAALCRGLRQERQAELEDTAGAEGPMREVTVVAGTDREDPQQIKRNSEHQRAGRNAGPEDGKACEVDQQEADAGGIGDVVRVLLSGRVHVVCPLQGV